MSDLNRLKKLWHGEGPNLNVGCGGLILPAPFINLDIKEHDNWKMKPDYKCIIGDARDLQYPDNYFWVIVANELIEHFPYGVSTRVLKGLYRVLKPGGCLKVCCPDFKFAVDVYLGLVRYKDYDPHGGLLAWRNGEVVSGNMMGAIWRPVYGRQKATEDGMAYITDHQTLWDEENLKYWLERIGFKAVKRAYGRWDGTNPVPQEGNLCMEAWK